MVAAVRLSARIGPTKLTDEFTVPLCRTRHREVHRASKEPAGWTQLAIEPMGIAHKLWRQRIRLQKRTPQREAR